MEFPDFEKYELGSQLRRAAISIPINIAEGYGKKDSVNEFKRFLKISLGSNNEVKVLLDIVKDLKYLDDQKYNYFFQRYEELGKQIYSLIQKLK